jgi:hypothetical protein
MSPFNLHGSNLTVETNVQGEVVDNDEWISTKNNLEHNQTGSKQPLLDGLPTLVQKPVQIEEDPDLLAANDADLNARGVATPQRTRKPRTKKQ